MASQCLGRNQAGGPCGGYVPANAQWCLWHDPTREAEREEWRRRGGAQRSNRARARRQLAEQVMSISDIDGLLCAALVKVANGRMDPGVGSAMATISKTITGIRTAGDLERRLTELEAVANLDGSKIRRFGA